MVVVVDAPVLDQDLGFEEGVELPEVEARLDVTDPNRQPISFQGDIEIKKG